MSDQIEALNPTSIPVLFCKNVRKYRKEAGLTQEQLSRQLDISQKHLSIIETGTQFASAPLIEKIANALYVSPATRFGGEKQDLEATKLFGMLNNFLRPRFALLSSRLDKIESLLQKNKQKACPRKKGNRLFYAIFEKIGRGF